MSGIVGSNMTKSAVIVGGGPAGLACGTLLAQAGIHVTICEKAFYPRDKICGECVNPRCWDFLELIGVDMTLKSSPYSAIERVTITNTRGRSVSAAFHRSASKPFIALRRSIFDNILADNARSKGARVLQGCQVTNIEWSNQWRITARKHGDYLTLTSDILIGSDGRNSIVAKKLARKNAGRLSPKRIAVQWHAPFQPDLRSSLEMFLFKTGYGGVVNVDENTCNVALVTTPELSVLASRDFSSFLQTTLFSNPRAFDVLRNLQPISPIARTFPVNPFANEARLPTLFLLGDARRTVEPFTGEGIYFALQDGISTARAILGRHPASTRIPFWSNRVFSPLLQRPRLAELLISASSRIPAIIPFGFRKILA